MGRRKLKSKSKAGAQKKKQKIEDAQPSSSSASSSSAYAQQIELNNQEPSKSKSRKDEDGPAKKKLKKESKPHSENQVEVENEFFIDKLTPELLKNIIKHLDTESLFKCRLVSRRWNKIALEILKSRDDFEVKFNCQRDQMDGKLTIVNLNKGERKVLSTFCKHFQASSKSHSFTRFRFDDFETCVFDDADWIEFISDFGENIKCLKLILRAQQIWSINDQFDLTEKLRDLLLNQLPNLEEFGLQFRGCNNENVRAAAGIGLFPTTKAASEVQLPHLKVVYIDERSLLNYTTIFTDLLGTAVNLERIEFSKNQIEHLETFQLLQEVEKLELLHSSQICLTSKFLLQLQETSSSSSSQDAPLSFKLKKLDLCVSAEVYNDKFGWPLASVFLSHLFESSKDTLTRLKMSPIGFFPQIKLSKFPKVTHLEILGWDGEQVLVRVPVFPSRTNLNEIFPGLQFLGLEFCWADVFPQYKNLGRLPNVTNLVITRCKIRKEEIASISQVCPNLKHFRTFFGNRRAILDNFPEVCTAMWTHLGKLKSLNLQIPAYSLAKSFRAVDSCFTGFSDKVCTRLNKQLFEAQENGMVQDRVSKSEMDRQNPSILDLKDLKTLSIRLMTGFGPKSVDSDSVKFQNTLNVSEMYAFKLMEGLNYQIHEANFSSVKIKL